MAKRSDRSPDTLRLAVFGMSGSGKTSLLSSYYGHQQSKTFEREHAYRIAAMDVGDGNTLLQNFYRMEEGYFPGPTIARHTACRFEFKLDGVRQPAFQIEWLDYPGEWWTREPTDPEEQERRRECLLRLLQCHVAFLVVDGARFKADPDAHLMQLFDQFRNVIRRLMEDASAQGGRFRSLIGEWVIVLTKSDLYPADFSASDFARQCILVAGKQLAELAQELEAPNFGKNFLMASAAKAVDGKVVDANATLGLELIAPLAFLAILSGVAIRRAGEVPVGTAPWWLRLAALVPKALNFVGKLLPPEYQAVSHVLKLFDVSELLNRKASEYREAQKRLAAEGRVLEAGVQAMKAELQSDGARRALFQTHR